eukprot:193037-Pleurochrysis_carterae.AAC.1
MPFFNNSELSQLGAPIEEGTDEIDATDEAQIRQGGKVVTENGGAAKAVDPSNADAASDLFHFTTVASPLSPPPSILEKDDALRHFPPPPATRATAAPTAATIPAAAAPATATA